MQKSSSLQISSRDYCSLNDWNLTKLLATEIHSWSEDGRVALMVSISDKLSLVYNKNLVFGISLAAVVITNGNCKPWSL